MDGTSSLLPPVAPRLISISEFAAMLEAGVFAGDDRNIELAGGQIIMAPSEGTRHLWAGRQIVRHWWPLISADPALAAKLDLYAPGSIILPGTGSVRAPDALLCPPGIIPSGRWPEAQECLLAVENSDSTLAYDDGPKSEEYARAGLPELWIVRIPHQDVRVCRGPNADGSWAEADLHSGEVVIAPLAAPALALRVGDLFS